MSKRKFVCTNRCFCNQGKNHPNFSFDIGSTWVLDGINCHILRLAPWERNVTKLDVLLLLLHNSSLTYLRNFLVYYSWSYIKIKKNSRDKGKEWIIQEWERERERERAPFVIQIFHDREIKKTSLPHFFLSVFEIQAAQISSLLADRSNCRRSGGWSAVWSRDFSSSLECLLPLSLSLSHTHTHTHTQRATPTLNSLSLSLSLFCERWRLCADEKRGW